MTKTKLLLEVLKRSGLIAATAMLGLMIYVWAINGTLTIEEVE